MEAQEACLEAELRHEFAPRQDGGSPRETKPSWRNRGLGAPGPSCKTTRPARRMRLPIPAQGNWKAGRLLSSNRVISKKKKKKIFKNEKGGKKLNLNKTKLQAHRSLRRKRGGGGGGGTAEALRVGDAARTPSPAESVPSGAPPPHAPTCKVWTHTGGRRWEGEARRGVEGGRVGGLFLLSPAPAEANWRWQSVRKL